MRARRKRKSKQALTPRFTNGTRIKISAITEDIMEFLGMSTKDFYNKTGTVIQRSGDGEYYLVEMDNWFPRLMCLPENMMTELTETES